jgi:hypothetical protein
VSCRVGRLIHGAKPAAGERIVCAAILEGLASLRTQRPGLTLISCIEATMSENYQRTSVTPQMVTAGAQAFDAGLGKLAESVLTAMAPWLKVTDSMREKGAGLLLGWRKPRARCSCACHLQRDD